MRLAERMARLFDDTEGCRALVFCDLQTETVLRACAVQGLRQERHHALLAEAAQCFAPSAGRATARIGGDACITQAICLDDAETRVHLRLDGMASEVISVALPPGMPSPALLDALGDCVAEDE